MANSRLMSPCLQVSKQGIVVYQASLILAVGHGNTLFTLDEKNTGTSAV
jgi:predicted lipoprotein with Yx(FWY)xxD motif